MADSKDTKQVDVDVIGDDNKSYKHDAKEINKVNKKTAKHTAEDAKETFGGKKPWYKKLMFWKK